MTDRLSTYVLSHDSSSNALGRALSVALVARELGPVEVHAFGGSVWPGISQFAEVDLHIHPRATVGETPSWTSGRLRTAPDVVWVVKGISPLPTVARHLSGSAPAALKILDLDDDDAALATAFRANSWGNRLRLNGLRRMSPERIHVAQRNIRRHVDGMTFSSQALQQRIGRVEDPAHLVVPHARAVYESHRDRSSSRLRVGLLGTIRPHKGGDLADRLLREFDQLDLVVFKGSGMRNDGRYRGRLIEVAADRPLRSVYNEVDVALIPMDASTAGADVQLPAKLFDAMAAGVGIVATPTAPIREMAHNAFLPLQPGASHGEVMTLLRQAQQSSIGDVANELHRRRYAPAILAHNLDVFLANLRMNSLAPKEKYE